MACKATLEHHQLLILCVNAWDETAVENTDRISSNGSMGIVLLSCGRSPCYMSKYFARRLIQECQLDNPRLQWDSTPHLTSSSLNLTLPMSPSKSRHCRSIIATNERALQDFNVKRCLLSFRSMWWNLNLLWIPIWITGLPDHLHFGHPTNHRHQSRRFPQTCHKNSRNWFRIRESVTFQHAMEYKSNAQCPFITKPD